MKCWCHGTKRVLEQIVRLVEEMYNEDRPNVVGPMPTEFPVTLGLHKGSALSHFLFVVLLCVKAKCYPGFVFLHNLISIFTF